PPGESASIRLEYVTELAVQADDGLRFCLPAVLNPRYQPQGSAGAGFQVISVPASLEPYSLSFSARVSSPRPISKVESNCSLDPLQYLNTDQTQATVKLAAGHKFDRDVELLIYYKDAHQPTAVVEAGQASAEPGSLMDDPVVMVSLYPEFPQSVMSSMAPCGEFVFLMDRSGSMEFRNHGFPHQTRIQSAKDTLLLLLKSLPMGCYFNIYSFGSKYEHIFPKSVEYSQKTMEEALKKVKKMKANLRGTKILKPLKYIYSQPCIPNQPRQLFVFTDGKVGNTKEVIDLVKKNSDSHRCFSFGIGEGASSALINGMAKEGGGHAQFITGTDRMQPKVMQSLRFALQPAVVDISVTWDLPKEVSVTVLSPPITTLFQGQRSLIYAQLTGQSSEAAEGCVTLKYSLAGHRSENQLHFSLRPAEDTGLMGDPVVMVSLYPEFPQSVMSSTASCGEFVFLIDRSGSMGFRIKRRSLQTCIHSAKDTLLLLLKSLPMGCYFNIYSFGSRYEHIFPKSVEYSRQTMEEALKKVKKMKANLGETEILEPLKHIYSQPCILNQPRQLFVLTRGWVKNVKEVIDLVKKNSSSHRCFSFGTGQNTSYNFINKISKEGGGHAQFITATDKIQPKVMQSLQFALQPSVIDISVTWDLPKEVSITVLSPPITSILQGQRSLIYAQLTGQSSEAAEGCVTLKYSLAGHHSENQLHFSLRPAEDTGLTVHMLAARTLIRSLEMEARDNKGERDEEVKKKVEELSIQSGVSSAFTAFIAVSKSSGEAIQGPLIPPPTLKQCNLVDSCESQPSASKAKLTVHMLAARTLIRSLEMEARDNKGERDEEVKKKVEELSIQSGVSSAFTAFIAVSKSSGEAIQGPLIPPPTLKQCNLVDSCESQPSARISVTEKLRSAFGCINCHFKHAQSCSPQRKATESELSVKDPLLQLVSLLEASGCWLLTPALASVLGKTSKQVANLKPASASSEVWATILALIWLHGFKMDAKDEWELLAVKAASWLRAQNATCVTECVEAGNALLGCRVTKDALGL
ncbi:von Willebrand factor A domain-containing protein 5A-like, partial [Neolamprologus brichardi]|uniref:von Willebrand factor A domain-containing protein 5A-like n=1 Tax=Neolamprologus brichardi TaxID=32507 RepID=UPI0003EBE776